MLASRFLWGKTMRRIAPVITFSVLLASGAALNGCATLSEEQCLAGDWYGIGVADGQNGYTFNRLSDHNEACASHGVIPDAAVYEQGRQQGLRAYCTPQVGFREGRQGDSYAGVCPASVEPDFLAGYSDGRLVHAAQQAYQTAYNDQSNYLQQAANIEAQIRTEETNLGAADLTDEQRRVIRDRIRRLRDDRERAFDLARDAEWRMRDAERDVSMLRARFAAYYGSW
jgi:hypothetical protein